MIDPTLGLLIVDAAAGSSTAIFGLYLAYLTWASGYLGVMRKSAAMNRGKREKVFHFELFSFPDPGPGPEDVVR
jgi:hypothetical protein